MSSHDHLKMGLCFVSFAFEACLYCPRAQHILYLFDTDLSLRLLIIILQLRVFAIAIEQQMKTLSRLSYLLSQLIPTPGCLLLSRQHREWQVENGIPPSALLFYWIFPSLFLLTAFFSRGLRIIFLHRFSEVMETRAK